MRTPSSSSSARPARLAAALAAAAALPGAVEAYKASTFQAYLKNSATIATDQQYELVMEWDHDASKAPSVGKDLANNAKKPGGACDPDAIDPSTSKAYVAADGTSYWMPRFFPTKVSAEVTKHTGIKFVSPDWQPCGHKDIVICHGESHYDFHLYYQEEDFLKTSAACNANPKKPGHYIICDDMDANNNKMFKLMGKDIPVSRKSTAASLMPQTQVGDVKPVNYCMDPTSGVPMSGMHYGDKGETLTEWKEPVTIMGSHDCTLSFFEPMISWKWISNRVWDIKGWPKWNSGEITYNEKSFSALPTQWAVEVSAGCDASSTDVCHIKVTVKGDKCPEGGCEAPKANCDNNAVNDCLTGKPYASPFKPSVTPAAGAGGDTLSTNQEGCEYGGATHCFTADGKTILAGDQAASAHAHDEHDHGNTTKSSMQSGALGAVAGSSLVGALVAGIWALF